MEVFRADSSGRHLRGGRKPPVAFMVAFLALSAALCLIPSVGMLWAQTTETTENRELAAVPSLYEDGSLNTAYLSDWGTYFEDHFAYRNLFVSLNSELRARTLQVSSTDSVVVGGDGWLYYSGTLSDYCGWDEASDRKLDNIAFNLGLMQGYCEANGAAFSFAVAPNKNSLYPSNMPYFYMRSGTDGLSRLDAALDSNDVNHADLADAFESRDELLYYERDTHWNTLGAYLAYRSISESLGVDPLSLDDGDPVDGYVGDLNEMLYPATPHPEDDYSFAGQLDWNFVEGSDVEDSWVQTEGGGQSSLLMFRDSFTNNMMQFFASSAQTAYFSKYVPYDLTRIEELGVDAVVIERAERHVADLASDPAVMPAPKASVDVAGLGDGAVSEGLELSQDGVFTVVSGDLPDSARADDTEIYIGVEGADGVQWRVPFRISGESGDFGYKAYLSQGAMDGTSRIWVACGTGGDLTAVQCIDVQSE